MSGVDVLAVMDRRRTAFRDPVMRRVYDACIGAYRTKGAAYMDEGNSAAQMFRRGFSGVTAWSWDWASRRTVGYAAFRAGEDCAASEARAAVAELMAEAQRVVDGTTDDLHYLRSALARCGGAA